MRITLDRDLIIQELLKSQLAKLVASNIPADIDACNLYVNDDGYIVAEIDFVQIVKGEVKNENP